MNIKVLLRFEKYLKGLNNSFGKKKSTKKTTNPVPKDKDHIMVCIYI